MKKILFAAVLASFIFTQMTNYAVALTLDEATEAAKQRIEKRLENRQMQRDTLLENIADRVALRFDRHEQRLENWIDRASQHIEKKETDGKDMTNAKKALETAKTSLTNATKLGDDAVTALRAVEAEAWVEQKADAKAAREAVKKAQVAYAQVIKDMKSVLQEMKASN